jgi:hypothetical protein
MLQTNGQTDERAGWYRPFFATHSKLWAWRNDPAE